MKSLIEPILKMKAAKISRTPCHTNRASSLGYFVPELGGCLRRGVYERTKWQEKELHDARVQLIFDEGNNQERQVLMDLAAANVQIIEQQSAFQFEPVAKYQLTGHIDGVYVEDGIAYPVEIKSMSPNVFGVINTFEDFKKKPWTNAYRAQITLYMLAKNIDKGIFVLKNKSTGELKQVTVDLDYDLGEWCLKACENINAHVTAGTLPDQITDREKCLDCPYKTTCLPGIDFGAPLKIDDDPEFEARLEKAESLKDKKAEYETEHEIIRDRAKATAINGVLNLMVGSWLLKGKTDSRGAFRLTIEKS